MPEHQVSPASNPHCAAWREDADRWNNRLR